ncbi:MAG: hypothetical protein RLZZ453_180 [Chlamydiota bacterium]|jgi:adenylate cyclase
MLFKTRYSLKSTMLTLFLALFTFTFCCILFFTYAKNYKSLVALSRMFAHETMNAVQARFEGIAFGCEVNTQTAAAFFPSLGTLDIDNPLIRNYFLQVIAYDPHFSGIYIGFPNDNTLGVMNTNLSSYYPHFAIEPIKSLPETTRFAMRIVDHSKTPPIDEISYLDSHFHQVATQTIEYGSYNATKRPWYLGAKQSKKSFWTPLYRFAASEEEGISLGTPILDSKGNIAAVVGVDLSLNFLSHFLETLQVGKSGGTFILDLSGKIAVSPSSSPIPPFLVQKAYDYLKTHPSLSNALIPFEGNSFLVFQSHLSNLFGSDWIILVIAPANDFLGDLIHTQQQIIVFIVVMMLIAVTAIILFSKKLSSPIAKIATEMHKINRMELSSSAHVDSKIEEIYLLDTALSSMRYVVRAFGKYVPKEIIKQLFSMNKEIELGGEKREVTIFFSDIADFTTITESLSIEVLMPLLTEYFRAMTQVILDQGGTIDKFMGDGIMAFWGAPIKTSNHAEKACEAALLCHKMLMGFNEMRKKEGKPEFPTRFGIHSGEVIAGNIGTEERMNYTVMGDAVNTTARLQEVDKVYHTHIIISHRVKEQLPQEFVTRPLDLVYVKGKKVKIRIHELIGKTGAHSMIHPSEEQIKLCRLFSSAYDLLQEGKTEEALRSFTQIAKEFPNDYPTQIYVERLQQHGER